MIKGGLARTCAILSSCMIGLSTAIVFRIASTDYQDSLYNYVYQDTSRYAEEIQDIIGIGTMEYYIENNTTDGEYDIILDELNEYTEKGIIDNLEVVEKDVMGVYYFYGNEYKMGDHILYEDCDYNRERNIIRQGNKLRLIYSITDGSTTYGWIAIDKNVSTILCKISAFNSRLLGILLALAVIEVLAFAYILNKKVVRPIGKLAHALDNYSELTKDDVSTAVEDIIKRKSNCVASLDISTNDEIEVICNNLKLLEYDINSYIDNLVNLKLDTEAERNNSHLLEIVATMQTLILKQMYVDFKSVLPILLYYFKADKVVFIDKPSEQFDIMVYEQNKQYNKYSTDSMEFGRTSITNTKYMPEKLRNLVIKGYNEEDVNIITFGDLLSEHKWEVIVAKAELQTSDIERDTIIRAIKCCVQSFFK